MKSIIINLSATVIIIIFFGGLINAQRLNILVIGNSICERNNMLELFQSICSHNGTDIDIKADFMGGATVCENLCSRISKDCNDYWIKGSEEYEAFVQYLYDYDYILLQGTSAFEVHFEDLAHSVSKVLKKKKTKLIIFQNYSTILWSDSLRHSMVQRQNETLNKLKKYNTAVLQIGDLFDYSATHYREQKMILHDGHPSTAGSLLIAFELFHFIFDKQPDINPEYALKFNLQNKDVLICKMVLAKYHEK